MCARIQECDITIIKKFIAENYKVSVILTKADQISEDVEDILRKEIQSQINGLSVIGVCSDGKTRAGISQTFGKKDIERQAFDDFFDSLILRLPLRCKGVMEQALEDWVEESKGKISDIGFMGSGKIDIKTEIEDSSKQLYKKMENLVNTEIRLTFKMYDVFSTHLGYPPVTKTNEAKEMAEIIDTPWGFLNVVVIGLCIICSPIIIIGCIVDGKNTAIEEVEKYICEYKNEFRNIIGTHVENITDMLKIAKLKFTEK